MSWMKMALVCYRLWHSVTGLVLSVWLIAMPCIVLSNNIVIKTGCTTAATPVLSVTLADENTVVCDSISCLDLMVAVGAKAEYSMPGLPCRVLL